jgi:hypothetical protein
MTSKTPQERFDQHVNGVLSKKGINISSQIVKKYGIYLRPSLYNDLPTLSNAKQAILTEKLIALELRRKGYAVWFG